MVLPAKDNPPKGWRALVVVFSSLDAAWLINRQIEEDFGDATLFRWRSVPGSTKVVGEFWFSNDAGR